jgi:hypothetical protein
MEPACRMAKRRAYGGIMRWAEFGTQTCALSTSMSTHELSKELFFEIPRNYGTSTASKSKKVLGRKV